MLNYEGNEAKRFFGLKAAKSGHFIIQEATTNDLVIMDNTGEEVMRRNGAQKAIFGIFGFTRSNNGKKSTFQWRI